MRPGASRPLDALLPTSDRALGVPQSGVRLPLERRDGLRARRLPRVDRSGAPVLAEIRALAPAAACIFALVFVTFVAWMNPLTATGTALLAAGFSAIGFTLLRAARVDVPSALATGALALVLSMAVLVLGALALALVGLPIAPLTMIAVALGLSAVVAPIAASRGGGRKRLTDAPATAPDLIAPPGRAALIAAAGLSALALFVLPFGLHALALVIYVAVLLWTLWRARDHIETDTSSATDATRPPWWARHADLVVLALLGLLVASRLVPFMRSPVPLGYDTGLYRAVQRDFFGALPGIPEFAARSWADVQPPGLFVLSDLFHLAGASTDATLWGLLILTQVLAAVGVWLLASDLGGRRAAHWALALFVISSVQYTLFYQVYFKQALALALLPYALWLWRRESWLAVPLGVLIAATHNMGFLLLGLILLSDCLWLDGAPSRPGEAARMLAARRYRLVAGVLILLLGLGSYVFAPGAIVPFLSTDAGATLARFGVGGEAASGSLPIDAGYYALLVLPLIPFVALTLVRRWRDPRFRLVVLWAAWTSAFVFLDLIFARRFIGSLDPAFIVLAAVAIAELTAGPVARAVRPLVGVAVLSAVVVFVRTSYDLRPAIAAEDLRDLETASQALPADAYLMAISGSDMPWVRGFGDRDTIAPGFFEHDRWSGRQWSTFWAPPTFAQRYELLAVYERPIYVFMRSDAPHPTVVADPRFTRISRTLWQYRPPGERPRSDDAHE